MICECRNREAFSKSRRHVDISMHTSAHVDVHTYSFLPCFDNDSVLFKTLPVTTEEQAAAFLANLNEMGFCDRQLNLRLLRKHNCDMAQVVTELLQLNHGDWYGNQY